MSDSARLLTADQVATWGGWSRATVYRWLASGELCGVKVGRLVRVRPEDLERFVTNHLTRGAEADRGEQPALRVMPR